MATNSLGSLGSFQPAPSGMANADACWREPSRPLNPPLVGGGSPEEKQAFAAEIEAKVRASLGGPMAPERVAELMGDIEKSLNRLNRSLERGVVTPELLAEVRHEFQLILGEWCTLERKRGQKELATVLDERDARMYRSARAREASKLFNRLGEIKDEELLAFGRNTLEHLRVNWPKEFPSDTLPKEG